jgi:hypothetical protein
VTGGTIGRRNGAGKRKGRRIAGFVDS